MRAHEREALRKRFGFRCGYCGVRERDAGAALTVDHFHPSSKGGAHDPENWIYCCHACNEFKGDYWEPNSTERLLKPLSDDMGAHFTQDKAGRLQALSATGEFHIARLHLNRPQLIAYRREWLRHQENLVERARRLERIRELEGLLKDLQRQLGEIRDDGKNT